jgi:hypothetical protein
MLAATQSNDDNHPNNIDVLWDMDGVLDDSAELHYQT